MDRKLALSIVIAALLILVAGVYIARSIIFISPYRGNLHMHTTCSDGKNTYDEMVTEALALQFGFIAVTDHTICPENISRCQSDTRIVCIPGQEVTGTRIHLLAIGTTSYINPNLPLAKQVEEIHAHGGIAIASHPNAREQFTYTDEELTNFGIDAMECTSDIHERRPLPCVYDSDAHNTLDLHKQFMSCSVPIRTLTDLRSAILSGKCSRATD